MEINECWVYIDGKHIGWKRFNMVKRAVEILQHNHPDIDWNKNNLVITIAKKEDCESGLKSCTEVVVDDIVDVEGNCSGS